MAEQSGKVEAKGQPKKPPLEYRRFKALLRKVVKAPPLRRPLVSKE